MSLDINSFIGFRAKWFGPKSLDLNGSKIMNLILYIYRLNGSGKQWHEKFDLIILSNGFCHNNDDKYIYS